MERFPIAVKMAIYVDGDVGQRSIAVWSEPAKTPSDATRDRIIKIIATIPESGPNRIYGSRRQSDIDQMQFRADMGLTY